MQLPRVRRDLEFFPVQHQGQQLVLIRDALGLVEEGKAVGLPLYQIMAFLDSGATFKDLQMALMRQRGGVLVSRDEINGLLAYLDQSFLLDTHRYREARDRIVADFTSRTVRPCSHSGKSYPADPQELTELLDQILASRPARPLPDGRIAALVAPHIDLTVGAGGYSTAYQTLKGEAPSRIILLGVGHHLQNGLFSVTDKAFETPLGTTQADPQAVAQLRESGRDIIAPNDFVHRSEHSIEFQVLFLQHVLQDPTATVIPILCGSVQAGIPEYSRQAYQDTSGPFLETLRALVQEPGLNTLILAGVDFSHIGPKFGHDRPAQSIERDSRIHDQNLMSNLVGIDPNGFWEESRTVQDRFNVCGFSALACLLEVMPECRGEILHYEIWHEPPTRSAVSFASAVFIE